jgi:DNA-binding winged helix-turn-helix (wHTH) protein
MDVLRFGPYSLDRDNERLQRNLKDVAIPKQQFKLLRLLVENAGNLVSVETLQSCLLGETKSPVSESNRSNIRQIKTQLAKYLASPGRDWIQNRSGRGYVFVGDVERLSCSWSAKRIPAPANRVFHGRDKSLSFLDEAWRDQDTQIVQLVADGGVGKSAIVWHWIERLRRKAPEDLKFGFEWSFYSQGHHRYAADSGACIRAALAHYGVRPSEEDLRRESVLARLLAIAIEKNGGIIVLDGLEPLQFSIESNNGDYRDEGIKELLALLSRAPLPSDAGTPNRLIVITTRWANQQLNERGVETREVLPLSAADGGLVLREFTKDGKKLRYEPPEELRGGGEEGDQAFRDAVINEFEFASAEFGGHPLALILLATYLLSHFEGDLGMRDQLPLVAAVDGPEYVYRHVRRVLKAYSDRFRERKASTSLRRAQQALRVLSLFDRPADLQAVKAVRSQPPLRGLTEFLLREDEWRAAVTTLRELCLVLPLERELPKVTDTHPLIREYFSEELQKLFPGSYRKAHSRLFEFHRAIPESEYPATLDEMRPLFDAVVHGCLGGKAEEAWSEVYWDRILRQDKYFIKHLGGLSEQLVALSAFFDDNKWSGPRSELSRQSSAMVEKQTAETLRALNRAGEADVLYARAIRSLRRVGNQDIGIHAALRRVELLTTQARLGEAARVGRETLSMVRRLSGVNRKRLVEALDTLAPVLHARGEFRSASTLFQEMNHYLEHAENQEFCIYLHSCLRLELGDSDSVLVDLERWRPTSRKRSLMNQGCGDLARGMAMMLKARLVNDDERDKLLSISNDLDEAVAKIRKANLFNLPWALIARAEFWHRFGHTLENRHDPFADLSQIFEIASRGQWIYHECPARLWHARCRIEPMVLAVRVDQDRLASAVEEAQTSFNSANAIIGGRHPIQSGRRDGCLRYKGYALFVDAMICVARSRLETRSTTRQNGLKTEAAKKLQRAQHYCRQKKMWNFGLDIKTFAELAQKAQARIRT